MKKSFLATGALMGASGVLLGAFGAHGLTELIGEKELRAFQTGVQYQFYHSFALMIIAIAYTSCIKQLANSAAYFFIAGIILFSGSLYLLSVSSLLHLENASWLGPLTPIGGLCFIVGWLVFLASLFRQK